MAIRRLEKKPNLFSKPRPTLPEFFFLLFVSVAVAGIFTYSDIVIHDGYVKRNIAECHEANMSEFCVKMRIDLDCVEKDQMCLYESYGKVLSVQVWGLGILMIVMRNFVTYLAGRKIDNMAILTSILWGFTAISLFIFGLEDYLYYAARGMPVPDTLPWLNNAGFFNYTKQFGNDPVNVDNSDLGLNIGIGIVAVLVLWGLAIYGTKRNMKKIQKKMPI